MTMKENSACPFVHIQGPQRVDPSDSGDLRLFL